MAVFRDTPQKRLDIWLESAGLIHNAVPRAQFLLVGDGPLRDKLEAQAIGLGLDGVAHFVGRQKDVRPYLASMDVFLISSAFEGFGIAPAEAMAMGVPVVATDVEGLRNIVRPGETGLLGAFDDDVVPTLSQLVVSLIEDPERCATMGVAARASVESRFSIERMQAELEEVYEGVLVRDGRRS